jgi:endonuclease/exonuclease/phosphatase family metal-dependent hydrolase
MNSRRQFLKTSILGLAGLSLAGTSRASSKISIESQLRVITYNVYEATGWPREHSAHVRNAGQMPARIAQELLLYDPDIVQFSEAPEERVVREIAAHMNMSYCFLPSAGSWPGALLTRHKILSFRNVPLRDGEREEDLFTRHWGKAIIRIENGSEIIVHSIHLYPHDSPVNNAIRAREITHILRSMEEDISEGKSILILADLNHRPDMAGYERWLEAGWTDTFSSEDEKAGFTFRADEPYQRIDYVLAHGPISEHVLEGRPLFEGAFRTNPDDPGSYALSDHLPHLAVFGM